MTVILEICNISHYDYEYFRLKTNMDMKHPTEFMSFKYEYLNF